MRRSREDSPVVGGAIYRSILDLARVLGEGDMRAHPGGRRQRAYKERVANLAPVADWLAGGWRQIGPVEVKM